MSETRVLSVSNVSRLTACLGIAGALLVPARLSAQRSGLFRAGVADVATGAALTGAEVILPELRLHARADGTGFATIPDVARGRHRVRVRFLGYAPADLEILFQGDTTEVVFNLEMRPRTLDTVVVSQKRLDVVAPFADAVSMRYRMGIGRFLAGA